MRHLEVEPVALPTAADALRRFAVEMDATPALIALPAALAEAVEHLVRTTACVAAALGAQAMDDAAAVDAAAETYRRLEALLIPSAVR